MVVGLDFGLATSHDKSTIFQCWPGRRHWGRAGPSSIWTSGALLTGNVGPMALDILNAGNVVNEGIAQRLEEAAPQYGVTPVRRIPCASSATRAQIERKVVVEASSGSVGKAIRLVWDTVLHRLQASVPRRTSSLVQLAWTLQGQWTRNAGQNTVAKGILHGEGL